jgi:hypothetical protein
VVESQQIQPTGEQLSIVIGDEFEWVGPAWWNMYVNTVPVYIYNVDTCKSFLLYYKSVFSQFRIGWVGHEKKFVRLDGLWNFYLHPKMGDQTYWPPAHPSSYFMTGPLIQLVDIIKLHVYAVIFSKVLHPF